MDSEQVLTYKDIKSENEKLQSIINEKKKMSSKYCFKEIYKKVGKEVFSDFMT